MFSLRRYLSPAVILAVAAVGPFAQVASAGPSEPVVPSRIAVEEGHKVYLVGHAVGVQIYSCNAGPSGYSWGLVAPRANLYDDNGKLIMTHFGGPSWQAKDGSKVVAQRVDQVSVDPSAITWVLLKATSATPGADGDRLAHTTYIQRVATTGGLAPAAADCNAERVGDVVESAYTADYYFWKATGA